MPVKQAAVPSRLIALSLCFVAFTLAFSLSFVLAGCRSQLNDSALAVEAATAPVVDQAAAAYRAANTIHNLRVDYDAVTQFDATDPVYNPRNSQVLLGDKDLEARLAVLKGLQIYVKALCAITSGTSPRELGEASSSVGGELTSLANTLAPTIAGAAAVASAGGGPSSAAPPMSPEVQNGVSTAIYALGKFLVGRKVKKELPAKIIEMDPRVQALAKLLESDIDVLADQEYRDYERILNLQTLFIRKNTELGPDQRRTEIMKLPELVRQQRAAQDRLTSLRMAIEQLAKAHHELASEAQSKKPESFQQKLQELADAASDLGTYYSSLPAQ